MSKNKDRMYSEYREKVADFVFDEKVVSVFDDMIRRSVPGYATVIAMTKVFAEEFGKDDTNCYDLGCSLGAGTLAMRRGLEDKKNCRIISVDNSRPMIERFKSIIDSDVSNVPVEVNKADIAETPISNASVVVMNYTLQFLSPAKRTEMIAAIYDGLVPGGVLLVSEKISFDDKNEQDFQIEMHHEFKKLNGYSDLEVSQKRKSLEKVMITDSLHTHFERFRKAGFAKWYLWFQCFNFVSMAAFKGE